MSGEGGSEARDLARTVHVLAVIGLVSLAVLIGVNHVLPAVLAFARGGGELSARINAAAGPLITMLPLIFFADAADKLRRAFSDFAEGRFFEARAARLVSDAGLDVAWAIGAQALIVPNVLAWVGREGGGPFAFDVSGETIALFGFALFIVAIGRILAQAAPLKAENDAII